MQRDKKYRTILETSMLFLALTCGALILVICFVWGYQSLSNVRQQNEEYNRIKLNTIYNTLNEQFSALKKDQYNSGVYRPQYTQVMSQIIEEYLANIARVNGNYNINAQRTFISEYLSSLQSANYQKAHLVMITGQEYSSRAPYYLSYGTTGTGMKGFQVIHNAVISQQQKIGGRRSAGLISIYRENENIGNEKKNANIEYVIFDEMRSYNQPANTYGYIVVCYDAAQLDALIADANLGYGGSLYVVNGAGDIIYDSDGLLYGKSLKEQYGLEEPADIDLDHGGYHFSSLYNSDFDYYVVNVVKNSDLMRTQFNHLFIIIAVSGICLTLNLLACYFYFRKRLYKLTNLLHVLSMAETDIKQRAPVDKNQDEIDAISESINVMLSRIEEYIRINYQNEIERQEEKLRRNDAELYALQAQLNPHFLYNTLESVRMRLVVSNDMEGAGMVRVLGTMLRDRIKGGAAIFLSREVELCEQLVEIYNLNMQMECMLFVEIPEECLVSAVLRDCMLPLIENALLHAVNKEAEDKEFYITISGNLRQEKAYKDMEITITDNGVGFPEQMLLKMQTLLRGDSIHLNNSNLGILNIHNRIRMIYGQEYGIMKIERGESGGTQIVLRIRYMDIEELEKVVSHKDLEEQ